MAGREALLARTFVEMADTLVADFDVADLLGVLARRCVELLDITEAGLMISHDGEVLRIAGSSSETMRLLELFELQHDEGPCVDCYRAGVPIACHDLTTSQDRWPRFTPEAIRAGFSAVYAVPMRLRDMTIGSLNLLRSAPNPLDDADLGTAQALADMATISILQYRVASEARLLSEQLERALTSRVTIEQAKGVIAQATGLDVDTAFNVMRRYARDRNEHLTDVAAALVERVLQPSALLEPPSTDRS